jgi:hypothetical protein
LATLDLAVGEHVHEQKGVVILVVVGFFVVTAVADGKRMVLTLDRLIKDQQGDVVFLFELRTNEILSITFDC